MNDPILLEMIEKDEANELKKEMNETESISNATQQQQHDDSDSESSPIIPRTAVDIGKLFDPATWVGVDMAIFDGEDDFD